MQNPFSLVFGKEPKTLIPNVNQFDEIKDSFLSSNPVSTTTLITGVRGSGKTVLLTRLNKYFETLDDWIVIELNPETDMLEYLASSIYENSTSKFHFIKKEFSFSFSGVSIKLSGDKPVSNVITLIEKMLGILKKENKKILVSIDDVSSNKNVRTFVQQYQIFIRNDYPLFLLMTGLYENVRCLQNEKSLSFLYRAPMVNICPLSMISIAESFNHLLNINKSDAIELAKLTKGYAFAYQALGYELFKNNIRKVTEELIVYFDQSLRDYVYEKVFFDLPEIEKNIIFALTECEEGNISEIMEKLKITKGSMCQYRDRLIKKGIIVQSGWGKIDFALPRFREYVTLQYYFE